MVRPKPTEWIEGDKLNLLTGWVRNGLTNREIAEKIGINVSTLYAWNNKNKDFCNLLKETKEYVDNNVENSLYKSAIGYYYTETVKEYSIVNGEEVVTSKKDTKKYAAPSNTAQIFWLKNRRRKEWRDRLIDIGGDDDSTLNTFANALEKGAAMIKGADNDNTNGETVDSD